MSEESIVVSNLINPVKELKFGPVVVKLQGVDFRTEQVIESIKYQKTEDKDEMNEIGAEYVYRMISYSVKDISGIKLKDPDTGEISDFKPSFKTSGQLSIHSYTVLMRALLNNGHDIATQVQEFYKSTTQLPNVSIENKKKD